MITALGVMQSFLSQAWIAISGALVVFAGLSMLARTLQAAAATAAGSRIGLAEALGGTTSSALVVLFAFLGVPAISNAIEAAAGGVTSCGPLADFGVAAAGLIGALAVVRIL